MIALSLRVRALALALLVSAVHSPVLGAALSAEARAAYRSGDYAAALPLIRASAETDDVASAMLLGSMYDQGQGVEKDKAQALTWNRKAAERNFAPAQFSLGRAFLEGDGVTTDPDAAAMWLRRSAEQGFGPAQYSLGAMMFHGHTVLGSHAEGYKWLYLSGQRLNGAARQQAISAMSQVRRGMARIEIERAMEMVDGWKPAVGTTQ